MQGLMTAYGQTDPDYKAPNTNFGRFHWFWAKVLRKSILLNTEATGTVVHLANLAVSGQLDVPPKTLEFSKNVQDQYRAEKSRLI